MSHFIIISWRVLVLDCCFVRCFCHLHLLLLYLALDLTSHTQYHIRGGEDHPDKRKSLSWLLCASSRTKIIKPQEYIDFGRHEHTKAQHQVYINYPESIFSRYLTLTLFILILSFEDIHPFKPTRERNKVFTMNQ
jgi:hypothetical protein